MLTREYNTRMFLFSRWITTNYPTEILNTQPGQWWKDQIYYFNDKVFPEYLKNGSFYNTVDFFRE